MSVRSSKSVRTQRPKTKSVETLPRNKGRDSRRDPYNLAMRRSAFLQCLAGSALYAQQPAPISVAVNEVIVPITVTDEKGRFVSDLKQEDFKIYDEGKLQKISYFSRERNQPVVVGFLLDPANTLQPFFKTQKQPPPKTTLSRPSLLIIPARRVITAVLSQNLMHHREHLRIPNVPMIPNEPASGI